MLHQTRTTLPPEKRDFSEWHRGRKRYAVWVLRCDESKGVDEKFSAARKHLKDYLLAPYPRQPHITLFVCGFLSEAQRYDDDWTLAQREAQIKALDAAAVPPFEIRIGGMGSFASAPFLEVHDPAGGIRRLREVLSNGSEEFRTVPYIPHLTIGLYSAKFARGEVLAKMAAFSFPPVCFRVDRVTLATYRAETLAGELCYEHDCCFPPGPAV